MELPDDDSEEEKVFAANATCKCSLRIGEEVGDGELDKQVAQYIADSGATCHMMPDTEGLTSYREYSRSLCLADRRKISIASYGDLTVAFRSNSSWVHVNLHDIAHVPLFKLQPCLTHLLGTRRPPICRRVERGNSQAKRGRDGAIPLNQKLCRQYWYRPEATGRMVDTACAIIAPGQAKAPTTPTDINLFHCTYGHTHETLLKQTAKQQGVSLLRKLVARSTNTRADKKLKRVFVDLSGKMAVPSIGGKRYTLIVRDDHTHGSHECTF